MQQLEQFIARCLADPSLGCAGLGLALVDGGRPVALQGHGVADIRSGRPYTRDTVQNIGSVSKAFISGTLGMLVAEGRLGWDEPVRNYIPELRLGCSQVADLLTVRDLTASRVPAQWPPLPLPGLDAYIYPTGPRTADYLDRLAIAPIEGSGFRSRYCYDGGFMGVAAILVERATGLPFADVQRKLLSALGMHSSSLVRDFGAAEASFHQIGPNGLEPISSGLMRFFPEGAPAGGMKTSASDYVRWMLTHLGSGDSGPLPRAVLDELHRPHIGIPATASATTVEMGGYVRSSRMGYALGWRTDIHRGFPSLFHGGSNPGIRAFVRLVPSLGRGIAVFQNSDANHYLLARALCELAFDLLDGLPGPPAEARLAALLAETAQLTAGRAPAVAPPPALVAPPTRALANYAGRYVVQGCMGGAAKLTDHGDHLEMQAGSFRYALHPHEGDRFHLAHVDPVFGHFGASGGEFRDIPTRVIFTGTGQQPDGFQLTDGVDCVEADRQAA